MKLAEYSLYRAPYRMYPSNCHEANYSLPNILRAQRVADERAARQDEQEKPIGAANRTANRD